MRQLNYTMQWDNTTAFVELKRGRRRTLRRKAFSIDFWIPFSILQNISNTFYHLSFAFIVSCFAMSFNYPVLTVAMIHGIYAVTKSKNSTGISVRKQFFTRDFASKQQTQLTFWLAGAMWWRTLTGCVLQTAPNITIFCQYVDVASHSRVASLFVQFFHAVNCKRDMRETRTKKQQQSREPQHIFFLFFPVCPHPNTAAASHGHHRHCHRVAQHFTCLFVSCDSTNNKIESTNGEEK